MIWNCDRLATPLLVEMIASTRREGLRRIDDGAPSNNFIGAQRHRMMPAISNDTPRMTSAAGRLVMPTGSTTANQILITQLLGFGVEKHDDGVDALVYLILGLVGEGIAPQEVHYV